MAIMWNSMHKAKQDMKKSPSMMQHDEWPSDIPEKQVLVPPNENTEMSTLEFQMSDDGTSARLLKGTERHIVRELFLPTHESKC